MRKTFPRISALLLGTVMLLSLCSCGGKGMTTEDASKCVQVELDATYKGQFQPFVDFYDNVTTEDARNQYNDNVEGEASYFLYGFGPDALDGSGDSVEPTDMQLHRAKELFEEIYAKAEYSIASSTKQDDGTFAVKLTIKPINILHLLSDNIEAGFEAFQAKYDAVDVESMSDEEFETWYVDVFARDYYDTLLDILEEQIPNIDYMDEKSIVIQVQNDEEEGLAFGDEDWKNLDNMIIDYNI